MLENIHCECDPPGKILGKHHCLRHFHSCSRNLCRNHLQSVFLLYFNMGSTTNGFLNDIVPRELNASDIVNYIAIDEELKRKIIDSNISGGELLDTHVDDLMEKLHSTKEHSRDLLKFRTNLRKRDFQSRKMLNVETDLQSFSWNNICQLIEKRVTPKNNQQRCMWYTYIEEQSIDGEALPLMRTEKLIKMLNMNEGQKAKFNKLMDEIKRQYSANNARNNVAPAVILNDSRVGVFNNGGIALISGNSTTN